MTAHIGIFYGSSTCYTEMAAERIQDILGKDRADLHNIDHCDFRLFHNYDVLIFGAPTWDYGELQEDWDDRWDELEQCDFEGKLCAVFGMGDQVGYPGWFQDSLGYLFHKIRSLGGTMVGSWPTKGYRFTGSRALTEDGQHFVGLPLDEENQADQTETRLQDWLRQIELT